MNKNTFVVTFIIEFTYFVSAISLVTKVTLPLGKLNGYVTETKNGNKFVAFEGVPYAKPPIGILRFEEPQPVEPWQEILNTDRLRVCIQYNHYTPEGEDMVKGEEDCLHLNVYTPDVDDKALRDVIIYIHGGAFMFGSGASYGPYILLDYNVVLVTLNYRLGPLGFLSTEDEVVPGNNGLKDQLLALKWIHSHIKHFGGNPNSITLTGMSAGGASAQFHGLSPLSNGLFHRSISQSGSVLNPWVMVEKPLQKAQQLATHLKCPTSSTKNMIPCLKEKSSYDIVNAVKLFLPWLYNPFSPFGVVVDKWSQTPFLNEHPYWLLMKGKICDIPWIFSHVESEGLYPAADFISKNEYLEDIDKNWNELIPHILDFNYTISAENRGPVLTKIKDFYFHGENVTERTFRNLVDMVSDRLFIADIGVAAKLHSIAVKSPVYYYYFSYRGAHSKSELRSLTNNNYGASHGDDTVYVLSTEVDVFSTADDKKMSELLANMWTSFSSLNVPTMKGINWLEMNKDNSTQFINYLHIKSPFELEMKTDIMGNIKFWDSLPLQENKKSLNKVRDEF